MFSSSDLRQKDLGLLQPKRDREGRIWYNAAQFRAVVPLKGDASPAALVKGMATVDSSISEGRVTLLSSYKPEVFNKPPSPQTCSIYYEKTLYVRLIHFIGTCIGD